MNTIVSTNWLHDHLNDRNIVIVDTRWVSGDLEGGAELFKAGHIQGALYLDVDTVLSDRSDLTRGRHPLPNPSVFAKRLADVGIEESSFIVAYDDKGGSVAARLWWMMRWIGLNNAAVLDGGLPKWIAEGRPLSTGDGDSASRSVNPINPQIHDELRIEMDELERDRDKLILLDARAPERYQGEVEPIDTRAGHIPGALNLPYERNLTESELPVFRSPHELQEIFRQAGVDDQMNTVCYCGSGVTACHNLLALCIAGNHSARLYPGSWSEWICHHDEDLLAKGSE